MTQEQPEGDTEVKRDESSPNVEMVTEDTMNIEAKTGVNDENEEGTTRGQTQLVTPHDDDGFSAAPTLNGPSTNPEEAEGDSELKELTSRNRVNKPNGDGLGAIAEDQKEEDPEGSVGH